jgi:hypothetical protein
MEKIPPNALASIEFQLTWQSQVVAHIATLLFLIAGFHRKSFRSGLIFTNLNEWD